jgi:hypothetical protein
MKRREKEQVKKKKDKGVREIARKRENWMRRKRKGREKAGIR